ncbi:B12-binding domain-containing radical SAM protein [Desulfurivibrio sp. D14AmB]|uniref:B12-binding domain-containing radical SAM protein n=1 Tax=Desulfurivibrio sp. D14AmB TaxID=3374370 RepID=UPI00376EF36F
MREHILLIHPLGYTADPAKTDIARLANLMPPLGLCSIAAYLERQGYRTAIIDCFAHPDSDAKILDHVQSRQPEWIGLTCTTNGFLDAIRIVRLVKAAAPQTKAVLGGVHISALQEKILAQYPEIDCTVVGEGELPLEQLLAGAAPESIRGLVYRTPEGIRFSGLQGRGIELDTLPFPAYDKLEGYPHAYQLPIFNYPRHPNASALSSRGCPYACSYCDRSVFRRSFKYNSADYVYRHMQYLKERWGIRHINFYDDQFTFHRGRVVELCNRLIAEPLGMTFNCAIRAEHVDPELLALMKRAGCWMASLGIETGDPELLAQHRQNPDLEMLARTIREIHRAGIRVKGLLMLGLPGESEESVRRSMNYVFSLPIDDFNLAKFTPFPGSPIYQKIHELGEFEEDYAKMDCMNFVFVTKGMTRERLDQLFLEFYRRHFTRPRVLLGYVAMLWKSPHSWWRFLRNLTSFLRFARSNKRLDG